ALVWRPYVGRVFENDLLEILPFNPMEYRGTLPEIPRLDCPPVKDKLCGSVFRRVPLLVEETVRMVPQDHINDSVSLPVDVLRHLVPLQAGRVAKSLELFRAQDDTAQ